MNSKGSTSLGMALAIPFYLTIFMFVIEIIMIVGTDLFVMLKTAEITKSFILGNDWLSAIEDGNDVLQMFCDGGVKHTNVREIQGNTSLITIGSTCNWNYGGFSSFFINSSDNFKIIHEITYAQKTE